MEHSDSTSLGLAAWPARAVLALSGAMHLYFGAVFAIDPLPWMQSLSLTATAPAGVAELRAFYGGLMLAMGSLFVWSAWQRAWLVSGLVWMTATYFGAAAVRAVSLARDGVSDPMLLQILTIESSGAIAGMLCLALLTWSRRRTPRSDSSHVRSAISKPPA
jgi:hypothetical protein